MVGSEWPLTKLSWKKITKKINLIIYYMNISGELTNHVIKNIYVFKILTNMHYYVREFLYYFWC